MVVPALAKEIEQIRDVKGEAFTTVLLLDLV